MICPYYKNKKVKDGFNEIVEALGGKPLTDEEFRSVDLRKLRTGRDFSAMNAAYIFYHRNNGNFIDETPNGKPSILFQTLLDLCGGDRVKAINEKVKVYSDLFLNWFGDWINDSANASKVVDENGEPLMVWHGGSNTNIFDTSGKRRGGAGIKKGIKGSYFTTSKKNAETYEGIYAFKKGEEFIAYADQLREEGATEEEIAEIDRLWEKERPATRAFFLSIKTPIETLYTGNDKDGYTEHSTIPENFDGQHIVIEGKSYEEYVATNPNQIKSAIDNNVDFSTEDNNIYHSIISALSYGRDLRVDGAVNQLKSEHIIHTFLNNYYITTTSNGLTDQLRKDRIEFVALKYGLSVEFKNTANATRVVFNAVRGDAITAEEVRDKRAINDVVRLLLKKIPQIRAVESVYIDAKDIPEGVDKRANAFVKNGVVYLVKRRVTKDTAMEEFLHPLVATIQLGNVDLFMSLYDDAVKLFPNLHALINKAYTDSRGFSAQDRANELVTQALQRYVREELKGEAKKTMRDYFKQIFAWIADRINRAIEVFGPEKFVDPTQLPKMTLKELAELIALDDTKFLVQYDEDQLYHSITESEEYLSSVRDGITEAMNVAYNAYKRAKNNTARRQKIQNELYTTLGKLRRVSADEAVKISLKYAIKNLGVINNPDGKPMTDNTVFGYLYNQSLKKTYHDTEVDAALRKSELMDSGMDESLLKIEHIPATQDSPELWSLTEPFSGITPQQLVDIYKFGIGFYLELAKAMPNMSDPRIDEEIRKDYSTFISTLNAADNLWKRAAIVVGGRQISEIVDREIGLSESREVRSDIKEVYKDWLTKNMFNGDLTKLMAFVGNYGQSNNPIIKMGFHLIQEADTKTLEEINPIQSNLIHLAKKAEKWGRRFSPTWLTIMLEKDRNGVPTGNFVRPLNYGLYEQDLNDFITRLNEEFDDTHGFHYQEDQYGILVRSSDGVPASHEEWIDGKKPPYIEYLERIELWKAGDEDGTPYPRVHRRYSYRYYLERISEPYDGDEDPETIDGPFKHGLSPKTLDRYEYITSNINKYMSLCKDPETGEPIPEKLSYEEALKLDQFLRELELLQNPYNLDGVLKQGDEYQIAMELRAWNRWVGEHLSSLPDFKRFYEEREKVKQKAIEENDGILLSQFDRFNSIWAINPAFLEATFGRFTKSEASPVAIKARMLKAGLQNLITFKDKFRRDLSTMEGKINYWVNCQIQDLILAYESGDSDKAFSEMLDNNYYREEALYKDPDGYYITLDGDRILESDIEDDTKLVTWQQYLIDKYTREALEYGVIEGYTDDNNVLVDFSGMNEDEVRRIVEGIFTYTQTYTDRYGVILEKQVPLSIFYTLIPKQKTFLNTKTGYVEPTYGLIPKGRFSETKNAEYRDLLDEEFDQSSNEFELPSMLFYDNSDAYYRIIKDKDLKKLYDSLIDAMKFATRQFSDRNATFNYRLPKMDEFTMGIASRMIRRGFKNTYNDIFDSVTKFLPNDPDVRTDAEIIKMPDGSFCTDIPLKYIGVLDDKTRYTSDIVGSVIMFVHMGLNYKNKQSILPQLEVFKYNLNENTRDHVKENGKQNEYRQNPNSKKMYESMLNKHVYGNRWSGEKHVQKQSKKEVAAHKAVRFWHRTETLQMLAFNLVSMTAGAIDSTYRIIKESILNKYMGLDNFFFGVILYIIRLPQMIMNIGNPDANNKITALMHLNGVSKDVREIVKHSNRGKTFKIMSSILMGGFSLLDWNNNCILLTAHYHNIKFYDGGIIPTGFYNRYQFIHAMKNAGVKRSTLFLSIQHSMLRHSLWDAYEFVPFDEADLNIVTKVGWKFMGKGFIRIKPKYEQYVTQKVKTDVRSKTLQRSALMNGMNPDNDIPRYKESLWGMAVGAMRGWLTLQVQHLISGSDDTSVRQFIKEDNSKVNRGVEKTNPSKKKVKLTNRQRAVRMAWNFETGTPQDLILIGLARSFNTLFRLIKYVLAGVSGKGWLDFKDTKFSYVERYAMKDAVVYLGMLYLFLRLWIPVDTSAGLSYNKYFANGYGRSDAGVQINISDPIGTAEDTLRYFRDVYIGKEVYKITIDDILFRTIEALLGNTNPYSAWELLSNLTVLKSGFDQQAGIADLGFDALGLTDHNPNEVIKDKSAFKYYTRKERALYKFFGPLKNLHTMFTVGGATSNLQYYEKTYGGIYKLMGYEFQKFGSNKGKKGSSIKKSKKNNRGSSSRGGSSRRGSKRGGSSR